MNQLKILVLGGGFAEVMADVSTYNFYNTKKHIDKRKSYWKKLHIVCVMDSGDAAAFVIRTEKKRMDDNVPCSRSLDEKSLGMVL